MSHLLPAYATGGLDEVESFHVRRHLRTCTSCRRLAAQYQSAFDAVGLMVPIVEPPARLRDRILSDLPHQPPYRLPSSIRFMLDHPKSVIAAGITVLLLFTASVWINISGLTPRPTRLAAASAHAVRLDPTKISGAILSVLNGTAAAPRARAIITVGSDDTQAVLYAFGLPKPPEGHVYQLWLMKGGMHRSGGIIRVTPEGHAIHYIQTSEPISEFASFGITLEPASGSQDPTGSKILENETLEAGSLQDREISESPNMQTSLYGIVPE